MEHKTQKAKRTDILDFIANFSKERGHDRNEVIDIFLNGCCFWFAKILELRFAEECDTDILYDYLGSHFACKLDDRVYDITGDITDQPREWHQWADAEEYDSTRRKRIVRQCIEKRRDG